MGENVRLHQLMQKANPEEWKPIPGYEGLYDVSDCGRVRSLKRKILRSPHISRYVFYDLWSGGKPTVFGAHVLVLMAFVGPKPTEDHQGAHLDGNPFNNHISNLAWKTPTENQADKLIHGTGTVGEKNPSAKLTLNAVKEIRGLLASGHSGKDLAKRFGVSPTAISRIRLNRCWNTSGVKS